MSGDGYAAYLFCEGTNFYAYDLLGAHVEQRGGSFLYTFRVWAPNAREIFVCGDFNDGSISYTHRILTQKLDDAFTQSGKGLGISYNQNKFYFRIDNILISPNLKAYNCTVDRSIKASDHYPIWCYISKR